MQYNSIGINMILTLEMGKLRPGEKSKFLKVTNK